jgi:GH25 family lysozyme M1 (1,4-beta-N-acetylmuramidase)
MRLAFASLCLLAACTPTYLPPDEADPVGGEAGRQVCGAGPTVEGIDVSYWQGDIDWDRVADSDVRFAVARVGDGTFVDPTFGEHWSEMQRVGLVRGAYQFFRPGESVTAQADQMIAAVRDLGPGDLAPVIDVETADGVSGAAVVDAVGRWLDRVEAATGRTPIIYAAAGFWDTLPNTEPFAEHPLWVANYGATCPWLPSTWSRWALWQYTDRGTVDGVAGGVDRNRFQGTEADLERFAGLPSSALSVDWERSADGTFTFTAGAPADVTRVQWSVDGFDLGSSTGAGRFTLRYRFSSQVPERTLVATGFDADGDVVARGVGLFDAVPQTGVFVRQVGQATYEVGLERAPAAVAAIEVDANGWPVGDDLTGDVRSTRLAVLHTYSQLGPRDFVIDTFSADGTRRGTLRRTFVLQ